MKNGEVAVPRGLGIGVEPLPDALAETTVHTEEVLPQ
jgi:hypothetical protein